MHSDKYEVPSTKYEVRSERSSLTRSWPAVLCTSYFVLRTFSAALAVLAFPGVALACPVCGLGNGGDNEWAYATMSVILSALPLGMMVAGTVWLSRRVKKADEDADGSRPASPNRPPQDGR